VARRLQLPPEISALVVQAVLIGAGLATISQALWMLRLPVLEGPAIVFVSVVPVSSQLTASRRHGLTSSLRR